MWIKLYLSQESFSNTSGVSSSNKRGLIFPKTRDSGGFKSKRITFKIVGPVRIVLAVK